jgi:hypothetical protein
MGWTCVLSSLSLNTYVDVMQFNKEKLVKVGVSKVGLYKGDLTRFKKKTFLRNLVDLCLMYMYTTLVDLCLMYMYTTLVLLQILLHL